MSGKEAKVCGVNVGACTAEALIECLKGLRNPVRAQVQFKFFKAEKGGYGEGDQFFGVNNPACRTLVKQFRCMPLAEVEKLAYSAWHEARLCGLLILVDQYKRGTADMRQRIVDLYVQASSDNKINNWDLVDFSAPWIVGSHEVLYGTGIIRRLAASRNMWKNRIAVVASWALIKRQELDLTFELAKKFMGHPHDLMHKACGWMLREVGKKDQNRLTAFLDEFKGHMPRTMLRYAIEHYPEPQRRDFLKK